MPFQPSQDLSPIYEEIHGGSRSSVSSGSGSGGSGVGGTAARRSAQHRAESAAHHEEKQALKFYYSMYDFEATDKAVMLTLKTGQVVKVLHDALPEASSGDWCYVEDREGNKGYVPRLYLKIYRL